MPSGLPRQYLGFEQYLIRCEEVSRTGAEGTHKQPALWKSVWRVSLIATEAGLLDSGQSEGSTIFKRGVVDVLGAVEKPWKKRRSSSSSVSLPFRQPIVCLRKKRTPSH